MNRIPPHFSVDESAAAAVEYAQEAYALFKSARFKWSVVYMRFSSDATSRGSCGSYEHKGVAKLLSAIRQPEYFLLCEKNGKNLMKLMKRPDSSIFVCLLVLKANAEYEIKFENDDASAWVITKLDGGTGIPAGLETSSATSSSRSGQVETSSPRNKPWWKLW